jgi:hypothetical protein
MPGTSLVPTVVLDNGHRFRSAEAKWSKREVDHSPLSSSEGKNEWNYTSSPLYVFMAWRGKAVPLPYFKFTLPSLQMEYLGNTEFL